MFSALLLCSEICLGSRSISCLQAFGSCLLSLAFSVFLLLCFSGFLLFALGSWLLALGSCFWLLALGSWLQSVPAPPLFWL